MEFSTKTFLFFILANLLVLGASSLYNNNEFLECLTYQFQNSNSTSDVIYTPNNSLYSSLMDTQNRRPESLARHRPEVIIAPHLVSQIQAAIYCSKKHEFQMRVRSGGHDYEGLSYVSYVSENPFFVVDLRNFDSISIDVDDNTAWAEAGATLGKLYYTIAKKNKTFGYTAGVCPTVGLGGHFSGGGYGMMSRRYGLAIDRIIDAKVMNADGQILDRKSMGEDLFWAIRGGGGTSFGIILAFKVKLIVVPETVTVFNVSRTLEQNATQLVHKWQHIADKIDDNLVLRLFIRSVSISPTNRNRTIQASFTSLFLGRTSDLLPIMQEKFPELGLVKQDCIEMSWIESVLFFAGLDNEYSRDILLSRIPPDRAYYKGKSDFVKQPIPENGLKGIWEFLNKEDNQAEIQFSPFGGILNDFSESETPFPHRSGILYMLHYWVTWNESGNTELERHLNWLKSLYSYMTPYVSKSPRTAYFNYKDLDIGRNNIQGKTSYAQASLWGFKYFKNNFNRLVRVKTKVDPFNFFRNEQSIPPLLASASDTVSDCTPASDIIPGFALFPGKCLVTSLSWNCAFKEENQPIDCIHATTSS